MIGIECSACGGPAPRADAGPVASEDGAVSWPTVRCGLCGHRQHAAMPNQEGAYGDSYYTHQAPTPQARDALMNLALRVAAPPGRVLDVGCGNGSRVLRSIASGYTAEGFDVDAGAAAAARAAGVRVRIAPSLDDAGFDAASFDLLFANHVAEHIPNPVDALAEMRRIVAPGGVVIVAVPNADGLPARVFGSGWSEHDPSRHLQFFSAVTLRRVLERSGWVNVEVRGRALLHPRNLAHNLRQMRRRGESKYLLRAATAIAGYPFVTAVGLTQEATAWSGAVPLATGLVAIAR